MKIKKIKKNLLIISISIIIIANSTVLSTSTTKTEHEKQAELEVYDTFTGTKNTYFLNENDSKKIINLLTDDINKESFQKEIKERINLLEELKLINPKTSEIIRNKFDQKQKNYQRAGPLGIFDVLNIFNGIFFAMKGNRTFNQLDLPVYRFPFLNSTMTAMFSVYSTFIGKSSVFTLGALGFKYYHDFNMTKYEFPHLPELKAWLIGFTGLLMKLVMGDDFGEKYTGTYFLGVGMTVVTMWDTQET